MKHRLRRPSDKAIARRQGELSQRCPACGKRNGAHLPQEAKICQAKINAGDVPITGHVLSDEEVRQFQPRKI